MVGQRLVESADGYFHDVAPGGTWEALPVTTMLRPGARLHFFTLSNDAGARKEVVVKVPVRARAAWANQPRPRLVPIVTGEEEHVLEYESLLAVSRHLDRTGDPALRAVRVLDRFPELRAFVMERVREPTLDHVMRREIVLRGPAAPWALARPLYNAGVWLRAYQSLPEASGTEVHRSRRTDVLDMAARYIEFLGAGGVSRSLLDDVESGFERRVFDCYGPTLPTALLHSDFAPRNVFVGPRGEVRVLDALVRWRAPIYEPLAYFLTSVQTASIQVNTGGLVGRWSRMERACKPLLEGYFHPQPVPLPQVDTYRVLLLLDRWAALLGGVVSGAPTGKPGRLQKRVHRYMSRAIKSALEA